MVTHRVTFRAVLVLVGALVAGAGRAGQPRPPSQPPSNIMTQEDWDYLRRLPPARRDAYMQARNERHQREMEEYWRGEHIESRKRAEAAQERARIEEERCLKLALGVSDEQWQTLGPKLRRMRELKGQTALMASVPRFDVNDIRMPFDEKLRGYERVTTTRSDTGSYTQWSSSNGGQSRGGISARAGGSAGGASFGGSATGGAAGGGTGGGFAGGGGSGGGVGGAFGGGSGFGGGRSFSTPFAWRRFEPENYEPTEGERLCEELFILLEDQDADESQVQQRAEALQRLRAEARRELAEAQAELAPMLTPRQRARLILMGYLD